MKPSSNETKLILSGPDTGVFMIGHVSDESLTKKDLP